MTENCYFPISNDGKPWIDFQGQIDHFNTSDISQIDETKERSHCCSQDHPQSLNKPGEA